jgi:hypothetical protein
MLGNLVDGDTKVKRGGGIVVLIYLIQIVSHEIKGTARSMDLAQLFETVTAVESSHQSFCRRREMEIERSPQ